jgi:hypothetical protein
MTICQQMALKWALSGDICRQMALKWAVSGDICRQVASVGVKGVG